MEEVALGLRLKTKTLFADLGMAETRLSETKILRSFGIDTKKIRVQSLARLGVVDETDAYESKGQTWFCPRVCYGPKRPPLVYWR